MERLQWYLESTAADGKIRRTSLRPLPFCVGRHRDCGFVLDSSHCSQRHAELFSRDDTLWLRDLDSTNGTRVNGDRLTGERRLRHGDTVHFANLEFRVVTVALPTTVQTTQAFSIEEHQHMVALARKPQAFQKMLRDGDVWPVFQPLVRLADEAVVGYEILGRGALDADESRPSELFGLAEKLDQEGALSRMFRQQGMQQAGRLPGSPLLFLNTHPTELADCPALLASMAHLRGRHPEAELVLEIHEAAATDLATLRTLRDGLQELHIPLAFDDFGTGQARLLELTEVAPRFLKFDAVWISGIDRAPRQRRDMVRSLLEMAGGMQIVPIAECVETPEEAAVCSELGFELAQGYHFGRPGRIESFH